MKSHYELKFIPLLIWLILVTSGSAFSRAAEADSAHNTTAQDTTAASDSLTAAQEKDSSDAAILPLRPALPSDLKYYSGLRGGTAFSITAPNAADKFKYMPPAYYSGKSNGDVHQDFQGSTAYAFAYTEELRKADQLKPEYGNAAFVVPILPMAVLALYGAKEGFLALQKDPPISFDQTDVTIMEIIWAEPNLMAVEYYQRYNQKDFPGNLTFMSLQQRLDKLVSQKVIESATDGSNQVRYRIRYDQEELLEIVNEEMRKDNGNQSSARFLELQHMRTLLLPGIRE